MKCGWSAQGILKGCGQSGKPENIQIPRLARPTSAAPEYKWEKPEGCTLVENGWKDATSLTFRPPFTQDAGPFACSAFISRMFLRTGPTSAFPNCLFGLSACGRVFSRR
jgi:hypothetical protein